MSVPPPPDDLEAIETQLWSLLEAGARSHRAPFHNGVVGTVTPDGPSLRTVILRGADRAACRLRFHTDTRSPKFAELQADPRVAWTFYDEPSRLQIRVRGEARVHHGEDPVAAAQWAATPINSRRIYHAVSAPGTVSAVPTGGLPPELDDARWTPAFSERARPQFAVVHTRVRRLEGLFLHHAGHRRMAYDYAEDGQRIGAAWLVP